MAARYFMVTYGVLGPLTAATPVVVDAATDTGVGDFLVATRDVTIGNRKDLLEALERIKQYVLSESCTTLL